MMDKEIIKNESLGEKYTIIHHPSGLDIAVWEMEGFSTTEALFAAKYGSINTKFKTAKTGGFIEVPQGIAHYLEHKLFENEDTDVFDLYAATGANANAFTSFDKTAYTFSTCDNWEKALEILLDFVQKPYFTDETVAKEQGIIAQEIKMCQDSPERKCFFNLLNAMYVNHPVKIDIAGTVESIAKITPQLLYDCYSTFYNLHNMVLSIAGNVDEEKVVEICNKMLKPAENIQLETIFPDEPEYAAKKMVKDTAPVGSPLFAIGFKCLPCEGIEYENRSIAASVLLQLLIGTSSPLYKELFDEGLVNSQLDTEEFSATGSFFSIIISGESRDPEEVYRRVCEQIKRMKREGLDADRFEMVKKSIYGRLVRFFNNPENCAECMVDSYFNSTAAFDCVESLAKLTPEDCKNQLDTLFNIDNSSVSIIVCDDEG